MDKRFLFGVIEAWLQIPALSMYETDRIGLGRSDETVCKELRPAAGVKEAMIHSAIAAILL